MTVYLLFPILVCSLYLSQEITAWKQKLLVFKENIELVSRPQPLIVEYEG